MKMKAKRAVNLGLVNIYLTIITTREANSGLG